MLSVSGSEQKVLVLFAAVSIDVLDEKYIRSQGEFRLDFWYLFLIFTVLKAPD